VSVQLADVDDLERPSDQQHLLRRELGRFDTVLFLISAMVVLDTIGAVSIGGTQVLTWLGVLCLTFFVPSALVTAELGAALPQEGGAYVWVRRAFGRRAASLTSLLYWSGTPVWVGGSVVIIALAVVETFLGPMPTAARYGFGLAFIAAATASGMVPLRYGKWVPGSGALTQIALLGFFTVSAVGYGVRHGVHGFTLGGLAPTPQAFFAVVPVLLYSFIGAELPSSAGEEMRDPRRDVPAAILQAGIAQTVMYAVPVVAVLAVVPERQLTSLGGFVDALRTVLTVYGGSVGPDGVVALTGTGAVLGQVTAVAFVWVLLASAATWSMAAARTQAAACADGAGPRVLGRISAATGVPVVMTGVCGAASAATFVAGLAATRADAQAYFTVALTGAITFDLLAFLLIYPSFLVLRLRSPELSRPFRVPGGRGAAWLVTVLATAWTAVAAVGLLWPGIGTASPDALLPAGFEGRRWEFEALIGAPVAVALTAFVAYTLWARPRRQPGAEEVRPDPAAARPNLGPAKDCRTLTVSVDDAARVGAGGE
jgi:glutamate:GABA antiporter